MVSKCYYFRQQLRIVDYSYDGWLLLSLSQVDQKYFHQVAEHRGHTYLSIIRVTSPPPKLVGHYYRLATCYSERSAISACKNDSSAN